MQSWAIFEHLAILALPEVALTITCCRIVSARYTHTHSRSAACVCVCVLAECILCLVALSMAIVLAIISNISIAFLLYFTSSANSSYCCCSCCCCGWVHQLSMASALRCAPAALGFVVFLCFCCCCCRCLPHSAVSLIPPHTYTHTHL